jgi:anthranilate synthase component 1
VYKPSLEEFRELARRGNLIPVYREVLADTETPVSAFLKAGAGDYAFLLESVEGGEKVARHSFIGSQPFLVFESKGDLVTLRRDDGEEKRTLAQGQDVLSALEELMSQYRFVAAPGLPRFSGGAVGYIGYDVVRFIERLPHQAEDDLGFPDSILVLTDTCLIFDHVRHRLAILSNALVEGDPDAAFDSAVEKIEALAEKLESPVPPRKPRASRSAPAALDVQPNLDRGQFEEMVEKSKEYVAAGDVVQVVLSQRLKAKLRGRPFDVYRALRSLNPSPYMYYLNYGPIKVIGSSPERLVSCIEGEVETRPIAGSRPRGETEEEDQRLEEELRSDEKERAEHIMLVDLGRNDVGRVCEFGSVKVDELMAVERYSHVMHLVSNVRGRLRPGLNSFDVLRACFPAGTVSGAPKVRAMEIIEELEPTRRGPYAGAVGYFSFSGNMDTAITIRTIVADGTTAYIQAGAGIVADSVPANEYQESMNKAMALIRALEMAGRGL